MRTVFLFLSLILTASHTYAAINLTIDTGTQTVSIEGTDTGSLVSAVSGGRVLWEVNGIGGTGSDTLTSFDDSMFTTSVGSPGLDGSTATDLAFEMASNNVNSGRVWLSLYTSDPGEQTIIGSGSSLSYSSMDAAAAARLEGLDGQTMTLVTGSGFQNVSVSVVPEPSSYSILAGIVSALFIYVRRRLK